ncbi:hypothetical protein Q9233_005604 [Columba guinea]|nr:hypothetical protein Q9233_005604 [Columba guinea]
MCCVFWLNIAAALIQILTAIVMVGWIMSIFWGMDMVILAKNKSDNLTLQLMLLIASTRPHSLSKGWERLVGMVPNQTDLRPDQQLLPVGLKGLHFIISAGDICGCMTEEERGSQEIARHLPED